MMGQTVAFRLFAVIALMLALFCQSSDAALCKDCFAYPNQCPTGSSLTDITAYFNTSGACPDISSCCVQSGFSCTLQPFSRCSNNWQSKCPEGTWDRNSWPDGQYSCAAGCPTNYRQELPWTLFCVADNCQTVAGADTTNCTACLPGYHPVLDRSCQLPPLFTFNITDRSKTFFLNQSFIGLANYSTNARVNVKWLLINISVATLGRQSRFTVDGSAPAAGAYTMLYLSTVKCAVGNTTYTFASQPASLSFNYTFPLGTTYINCSATDMNGLSSVSNISIVIRDAEIPQVTCPASFHANTDFGVNRFFYDFPRNLSSLKDNVGITSNICTGNGNSNLFTVVNKANQGYTITCTARDAANNVATCTYGITVFDREAPRVTCPANRVFFSNRTLSYATSTNITFLSGAPNSFDNVGISLVNCTTALSRSTQYPIGNTLVRCFARDFNSNTTWCNITVLVIDNEIPVLTCPNFTVSTLSTTPYAMVTMPVTAWDNSLRPTNISCNPGGYPNAYLYMVGNSLVTCWATDPSNNTGSCNFTVSVLDQTSPDITCPIPITTDMLPGQNYANSSFAASAWDNVNVTNITCIPASGSKFYLGPTVITCTAYDTAGNSEFCQTSVNVLDQQPPSVSCPSSLQIPNNKTSNITVSFTAPNSTDNFGISYTRLEVAAAAPLYSGSLVNTTNYTFVQPGTVTFTYYAYDIVGNSDLCYWSITVLPPLIIPDTTFPTIHNCPTNVTYANPSPNFFSYPSTIYTINTTTLRDLSYANITLPSLNASDTSGTVSIYYLDWSANPQTTFFVGYYIVAFKAVDPSANTAYCTYRVQVVDPQIPKFTNCPINMTSRTGHGRNTAPALSWPPLGITTVDNVLVVDPYGTCVSDPPGYCPPSGQTSTALFPVGVVNFLYTAVDSSGNLAVPCAFSVTVIDDDPPQLSGCPTRPITVSTTRGTDHSDISSVCPNFTYSDNVDISSTQYSSVPTGYNCTTEIPIINGLAIQYLVTDTAGLTTSCLFTISVLDREPPIIPQCGSSHVLSFPANTDPGSSTANVTWPDLVPQDNSGTATITSLSFPTSNLFSGSLFPLGVTSVLFNAQDPSLNGASCIVIVSVTDHEPPTVYNCPSQDIELVNLAGYDFAYVELPDINATDNVGIQGASFFPFSYYSLGNFSFPVGVTPLLYSAQDTSFNQARCQFSVIVRDNEAPVFSGCPTDGFNVTTDPNLPSAVVSWPEITVSDNVDNRVLYTLSSFPQGFTDGSAFLVGTTVVTLRAYDSANNLGICSFTVRVEDNQAPTIICADAMSFQTSTPTDTVVPVSWRSPIVTDNYIVASSSSNLHPGNFSLGRYVVYYNVTDQAGNSANCTFNVSVMQMAAQNLAPTNNNDAASSGASLGAVAGGAGGAGFLAVALLLLLLFMRRKHRKNLQRAVSGYAEFLAMSDELILERARTIQQALLEQRAAKPPRLLETEFVHPERKFAPPPSTLEALMVYMRETVGKEISREHLELGSELGHGEFGSVMDGHCQYGDKGRVKVAIKMLKQATEEASKVQFLKEAAIMAQFSHPNIVELVGVCTMPEDEPTLIVLEYMHLGSLHSYLRSPMVRGNLEVLTMVRMALDVAAGMQYLAEAGFVHRDLAARNVLLDKAMTCRIADFGLSIDIAANTTSSKMESIYGTTDEAPTQAQNDMVMKLPIRWTSLEGIMFKQFSSASDVWSFGIVLWEIFSYAEMPYDGWPNKKVMEEVSKGYRLPKPDGCPYEVYRLMIECWDSNVKRRATFYKAHTTLVEVWKDIDKSMMVPEEGGANNGTLYETSPGMEEDQMLYGNGVGGAKGRDPPSDDEGDHPYDGNKKGDEDDYAIAARGTASQRRQYMPRARPESQNSAMATGSNDLYDVGDDVHAPAPNAPSNQLYDMGTDAVELMNGGGAAPGTISNPLFAPSLRRGSAQGSLHADDDGYLHMTEENAM